MKIARHSFVPPIKDVTAASQGVNSKWGLALPSAVRSRNDLYFSCFLPPLSHLLSPSVILNLSPLSPSTPQHEPLSSGVLTGLSHSNATRRKLMCPGLCGSSTPCAGTSASALSRIHGSGRCGKKIKKEQGGSSKNSWTIIAAVLMSCDVFVSQHCG